MPADPLPWLLGVARKVLADEWRTSRRQQALIARITESESIQQRSRDGAIESAEDSTAHRQAAIEALTALPELDREALLLVAWDGLTTRQAAAVLGCSRGAFAVRLFRARSRLKDHLSASQPNKTGHSSARAAASRTTPPNSTNSEMQEDHHD